MIGKKVYPIIVFDFGGVLLDWNPRYLYHSFFDGNLTAMENFLSEINFVEWNLEQDKGRPFAEGIADLSKKFPRHSSLIAAYNEHWESSISGPIEETVDILRLLKQKEHLLFGLSNWSTETFNRIRPKYDFLEWFDGIVISGEVKVAKPDRRIYEHLLKLVNDSAENCLFIDDSKANIVAAMELGFMTIHFESPQQLKRDLSLQGLL
jgi:2-haloacid dehalogenase